MADDEEDDLAAEPLSRAQAAALVADFADEKELHGVAMNADGVAWLGRGEQGVPIAFLHLESLGAAAFAAPVPKNAWHDVEALRALLRANLSLPVTQGAVFAAPPDGPGAFLLRLAPVAADDLDGFEQALGEFEALHDRLHGIFEQDFGLADAGLDEGGAVTLELGDVEATLELDPEGGDGLWILVVLGTPPADSLDSAQYLAAVAYDCWALGLMSVGLAGQSDTAYGAAFLPADMLDPDVLNERLDRMIAVAEIVQAALSSDSYVAPDLLEFELPPGALRV